MISVLLDALADRPGLLRAVIEQTPRLSTSGTVFAFEQQLIEVARTVMTVRRDVLPTAIDPAGAAWMLVRTVQQLTIRYLLDRPTMVRAQFVGDLTRLVLTFLQD